MSRNSHRTSAPSQLGTTTKQTRSITSSRTSPYAPKGNHDTLRDSDVSHQQPQELKTSSVVQQKARSHNVNGLNKSGQACAADGSAAEGEDESAEADPEEDDNEPIAIAPSGDSTAAKESRAGLNKDVARKRNAAARRKRNLRSSSPSADSSESSNLTYKAGQVNTMPPRKKIAKISVAINDQSEAKERTSGVGKNDAGKDNSVENAENSDEDDYNGVDLISDSDEEEPEVEQLEEKMIIDSEDDNEAVIQSPRVSMGPPSISSGGWDGFDLDDGVFLSDVPFFDEQISRNDPNLLNEIAIYNAASFFEGLDSQGLDCEAVTSPTPRRVRFEEEVRQYSDSTSTDGSDEDEDGFPDLFMHQDSLDPGFRLMIENDNDEDDGHSLTDGEGSYWDLKDRDDFEFEKHGLDGHDGSSSCGSSSGYETDEGDTTDEDLPPPSTVTRPRSILRRASTSSLVSEGDENPRIIRRPTTIPPSRRFGPSMGSWIADPNKPIAVIDCTGKRMVIYPARNPSKRDVNIFGQPVSTDSSIAATSPRTSFVGLVGAVDESDNDRSDFSSQDCGGPMLNAGANLMMPGLFHGAQGSEHFLGGQVLGPPEAFYPFKSIGPDGNVIEDDDDDDDDEDDENLWNVHDFIDFGDGSSESGDNVEDDTEVPPSPSTSTTPNPASTPAKPEPAPASKSTAQELLDHFDRGVVTAFRRNQHRHQTLLRRPQHPEFMGAGPSSARAVSAIKGGRALAANSPISPLRKRKASVSIDRSGSPLVGIAAKRRLVNVHKRSKSSF
ncbi:MAG: hypothetical protein M1830_006980 [Pleopsidium flavum]|nr:MAG: hypothetical protein M1830_006980 [Pleopsidium flavum]